MMLNISLSFWDFKSKQAALGIARFKLEDRPTLIVQEKEKGKKKPDQVGSSCLR